MVIARFGQSCALAGANCASRRVIAAAIVLSMLFLPAISIRADAGLADGLGPALDLLRQELGEIFGAAAFGRNDLEAELLEALADRRIVEHIAQRLVELAHDRLRRSF